MTAASISWTSIGLPKPWSIVRVNRPAEVLTEFFEAAEQGFRVVEDRMF